ncbi:TIGR02450 family Trp-rich protein [Thalassotalea sp. HSM 43]|uniref:TIGR02450 family Trp-rich protein n=1 Tax=Thalassotalea sp. HSM 43 TaxID=2552945 RepID=UPI00107FED42|nr:TIGR02450 family Trp-rich protein [Thalassotalea sp. HSM 43]QBY03244.1 TIGR02450 family Trp-rich protein [Thalassotalea sp. HSM 43]
MISPKKLLNSKWTKLQVNNKERHFFIAKVTYDDNGKVIECLIQAVINNNQYDIDWRQLKDSAIWRSGWH